jgi:hypothetical protein
MNSATLLDLPPTASEMSPLDDEMTELALLLPTRQAQALQAAAHDRGLTAAQLLRSLIRDFCEQRARGHLSHSPEWYG